MTAAATSLPSSSAAHNFEVASNPTNQKRPLGLNLNTSSNTHGFPHYPVSAPSSSAAVRPVPPNHSPTAPLQRNASFSFAPSTVPNSYPLPHALASAPPSATIPLPHSSMPTINQVLPPQNSGRGRLPLLLPSSVAANVRPDLPLGPDSPSSHPSNVVRPSSSAALPAPTMPNGKTATRDGSVVPPTSLSNFPGLGFAVQSIPQGKTVPPSATTGSGQTTCDAGRFFNTYIYDYLLKQGLLEVARAFVMSGAEFDLLDGREATVGPRPKSNNHRTSNSHKRRRSEASINNFHSSPHGTSNMYPNQDGQNSAIPKGNTAACELLPSERSMSSSGSSVSNASHYGFNHTDSNRSSNETCSQGPNSDSATNPAAMNGTNGVGASSHTSASPRSSPPDSLPSLENLPKPKLAMDTEMGFLFEWWSIFWDVFRAKTGRASALSKPAQIYAQSVASLGASTESNGVSKARREGYVTLSNSVDLQRGGQLSDRIQQQYTLHNSAPYDALHQDPANPRLNNAHQVQAVKQALIADQAARQQHINRMQQQQHFPRVDTNLVRQRQQQVHVQQQQVQAQQQQQQQQELQQRNQEMRQPQQMHQIHPGHPEQFMQQRQLPMNVRRVAMLGNMSPDQAHSMMPPPCVQHSSPLNPHQQAYRSSRPPSRSGTVHVPSPFASNQAQPPRQPSRASNHANSPAMQQHPRTPSASHASTPQPSVPPTHNRVSPVVSNGEQERKKRRLNEPAYGPNDPLTPESSGVPQPVQPLHQPTHPQQMMLVHQQQMSHHHLQMNYQQLSPQYQHPHQQHPNQQNPQQQHHISQMQPPRRPMNPNSEFTASTSDASPSNMNAEAYKHAMHAKHNQTSPIGTTTQKGPNVTSPIKEAANKPDDPPMPPPSNRNAVTQPSTPQSSTGANKTTESTPLPTIVAPSPNIKSMRPASRNDQNHMSGPTPGIPSSNDTASATLSSDQSLAGKSNPNGMESKSNLSTGDGQAMNLPGDTPALADHQNDKSIFPSEVGSKPQDKSDNLWSLDPDNAGSSNQNANRGVSSNMSPTTAQNSHGLTSDDLAPGNTNPMDQLFNTDAMGFDLDTCLFEAFINFDPTNSDLTNAEFS